MTMTMTEITARAESLMPDYYRDFIRFSPEQLRWLGEEIDPAITDLTPVSAHRICRSLNYQGMKLEKIKVSFDVPEGVDARQWACEYVAEVGLCMELRNAADEIVFKATPPKDTSLSFM